MIREAPLINDSVNNFDEESLLFGLISFYGHFSVSILKRGMTENSP
jgi:hypothetical protein